MGKNIVFILGAGFSRAAKLPLQRDLLPRMLNFEGGDFNFKNARDNVKEFINGNFPNVKIENLTLEDLFTILDKAVLGKEYFGGYSWEKLYKIRKGLVHTLLVLLDSEMKANKDFYTIYNGMGQFVIDCCQGKKPYNAALISINWDTLFESIINSLDREKNQSPVLLDYCTFNHSLENPGNTRESSKSHGNFLKIMKLHGSLNWLYCPNCGRLYTDRYKNIGITYNPVCPCCQEDEQKIVLEEMIITPTMLKEFQNHHLKLTWQHAFIEISHADLIVFIGYSLPPADFELRYFFKKAFHKKVSITAVLHASDETNGTRERYESFFGTGMKFNFSGFENWWADDFFLQDLQEHANFLSLK